jgi:[ribosomal protein S5]-alanine N-acetyltransferase
VGAHEGPVEIPVLEAERLVLRPFVAADAPTVEELAGDAEVAGPTLNIPHPYPAGLAAEWIASHAGWASSGERYAFAIERRADGALLGAITANLAPRHRRAELGYWLGRPYWGQGYTSEAARRVTAFCFDELGVHRVQATCFIGNVASARVMEKAGMHREGVLRGYVRKGDAFLDTAMYALLRADYEQGVVVRDEIGVIVGQGVERSP